MASDTDMYLSIGEFSRRVGVSVDLLRAWERRYGVPQPARAANGQRLYSRADELVVQAIRRAMARGMPIAEAARLALDQPVAPVSAGAEPRLPEIGSRLRDALSQFDEAGAQEELDRLFGAYSVDTALARVILPYLRELGERWARNEIGVEHEHFASNLIHGRLLSHARKWDAGHGPRALLACPSGELHTIGLLCFGLALRMHGWRITYLGADTPVAAISDVAVEIRPVRVVLSSVSAEVYRGALAAPLELPAGTEVAIGGAGASARVAAELGARHLAGDPVAEAAALA